MLWWFLGLFLGLALVGLWMSWRQALRFRRNLDRVAGHGKGTVTPVPFSFPKLILPVRGGRMILSAAAAGENAPAQTYVRLELCDLVPPPFSIRSCSLPSASRKHLASIFKKTRTSSLSLDGRLDKDFEVLAARKHHDGLRRLLEGGIREHLLGIAQRESLRVGVCEVSARSSGCPSEPEDAKKEAKACLEIVVERVVEDASTLEALLDLASAFHAALQTARPQQADWSAAV